MLPKGPSWKWQVIHSPHSTKHPIRLFWRDPVECLESLFSNPLFHDKLDFVPRRVYTTAARVLRVYSEWLTGDFAWDIQVRASGSLQFASSHHRLCRTNYLEALQSLGLYYLPTKQTSPR